MNKILPLLLVTLAITGCSANNAGQSSNAISSSNGVSSSSVSVSSSSMSTSSSSISETSSTASDVSSSTALEKEVTIITYDEGFSVYNEWQSAYINSENYEDTGVASGIADWSRPAPIQIAWTTSGNNSQEVTAYRFLLKEDNEVIKDIELASTASSVSLTNLKMRIAYTYELKALINDEVVASINKDLIIDQKGPRLLDVEGVDNMRDLGGYGLKQGLIYRSGRLSEEDGQDKITPLGKQTMLNELGIKSEIDLRRYDENGGITVSPLGSTVNYLHLPMVYGGNNIATYKGSYNGNEYDNPKQIKDFFTYLSEENNYPLVFHCSIGKDRTGCLAYLLEGLLGVEEEYLYRDYLFSNFSNIGSICKVKDITGNNRYGQTIKACEGETINDKVRTFLTSETIGLEEETLNKVISILEDKEYGRNK